ncbi:MAG TPA: glycosyltransferase family 4 protein [Stellaceae bacterium]|jgi:glycosyltransferase involved in cell wall biosynthesis|nr:glycosyltransferase family 4 protein [Stellaceae bacterium]
MRIAQVAPLTESCPPQLYGGTERVVSHLTEELVRQGHEVTLFASGDSRTNAVLQASCEKALRLDPHCQDPLVHHMVLINRIARSADLFDIIHFHIDYLHFPLFAPSWNKTLTTFHGRLDLPDLPTLLREFPMMPLVSISNAQRVPVPWANWHGTVHHGLPPDLYTPGRGSGGYLAFVGRISPEKGPEQAIEIARRAGLPLIIAAKIDKVDREYFKARVEPLLNDPLIEFIGEVDDNEKNALLGDAMAVLFSIDWPEPFGLVLIEAMACGTPAIGFRRGAVPEVIEHGSTGFVVDSIDEAVAAIPAAQKLDRRVIRQRFVERFQVQRMARDYVDLYANVLRCGSADRTPRTAAAAD